MGFKINSKKILTLSAAFMLLGTNMLMAQTETSGATATTDAAKADMWLGVGYYTLLLLLGCIVVAVIGKILKIYDLTLQLQGKKGMNWNCCHPPEIFLPNLIRLQKKTTSHLRRAVV